MWLLVAHRSALVLLPILVYSSLQSVATIVPLLALILLIRINARRNALVFSLKPPRLNELTQRYPSSTISIVKVDGRALSVLDRARSSLALGVYLLVACLDSLLVLKMLSQDVLAKSFDSFLTRLG